MLVDAFVVGDFAVNAYFFCLEKGKFCVIDPGGDGEALARRAKSLGGEISAAVFTHGHFDHTGGLTAILQEFPFAKIYVSKGDSIFFGKNSLAKNLAEFSAMGLEGFIDRSVFPLKEPDFLLSDGQTIFEGSQDFPHGLKILESPGHTEGSICLYSAEKSLVFSGDTIFACGSCGRTDGLSGDSEQIRQSVFSILSLPDETKIFSGHGASTTVAREKNFWPFFARNA